MNSLIILTSAGLIITLNQIRIPFASGEVVGALYFMSNEIEKNEIVITAIDADGTLKDTKKVTIAGAKGVGAPSAFSSNNVIVRDNFLFNLNYGSNSVSSFTINPSDPMDITHVSTEDSGGERPCSIAYLSPNLLCVANCGAEDKSGIVCFSVGVDGKLGKLSGRVPFGPLGSTIPLPFFMGFGSPSDMEFTQNNKFLTVTIKGLPIERDGRKISGGYILNYPVLNGSQVLGSPIRNKMGSVTYSFNVLNPSSGGNIIGYVDPGKNEVKIVEFSGNGRKVCTRRVEIVGQANICWSYLSPKSKGYFIIDAYDKNNLAQIHELAYTLDPLDIKYVQKINAGVKRTLLDVTIVPLAAADFLYVIHAQRPNGTDRTGVYIVQINGPGDTNVPEPYYPPDLPNSIVGMAYKLKKS